MWGLHLGILCSARERRQEAGDIPIGQRFFSDRDAEMPESGSDTIQEGLEARIGVERIEVRIDLALILVMNLWLPGPGPDRFLTALIQHRRRY